MADIEFGFYSVQINITPGLKIQALILVVDRQVGQALERLRLVIPVAAER